MKELNLSELYAKRHDAKMVHEHLWDYILLNVFSPEVLKQADANWEKLPKYVTHSIPDNLKKLTSNSTSDEEMNKAIFDHWLNRGIHVLTGYSDTAYPLTATPKVNTLHRNLLSEKGENRLAELHKIKEAKIKYPEETTAYKAFTSANKIYLDLDLFISMDHLEQIPREWTARRDCYFGPNDQAVYEDRSPISVPMTSGCYNGCVHCGNDAQTAVSHVPYPIFLKIYSTLSGIDKNNLLVYEDSDPIAYQDNIIGADAGDVLFYLNQKIHKTSNIITKGVLKKNDDIVLSKLGESCYIEFSFIDIKGENIQNNLKRVKKSVETLKKIPEERSKGFNVRQYYFKKPSVLSLAKELGHHQTFLQSVAAIGRFKEQFGRVNSGDFFAQNRYSVASDGMIYDVYTQKQEMLWQPVGNVFDKESIKAISTTKTMHPTKGILNRYAQMKTKKGNWQKEQVPTTFEKMTLHLKNLVSR